MKKVIKKEKYVPMFKNKKGDSVPVWYKGYDIKWLKYDAGEIHPDYKLVKEYEAEYGEF